MKFTALGIVLIIIAGVIFLHQFMVYGIWWEWSDLSHEGWIIMFAFSGIVVTLIARGRL